jgi:hypothetical protein
MNSFIPAKPMTTSSSSGSPKGGSEAGASSAKMKGKISPGNNCFSIFLLFFNF